MAAAKPSSRLAIHPVTGQPGFIHQLCPSSEFGTLKPFGWDALQGAASGLKISAAPHSEWYATLRQRILKSDWNPDALRAICSDPRTAARLATLLRKAKLKQRADSWNRGEFVRLLDPIVTAAGDQLAAANTEFRITLSRAINYGDSKGMVHWRTEKRQEPRELDIAIDGIPVFALRLQPTAGGDPIAVMADAPRAEPWHLACQEFRNRLRSAQHDEFAFKQGTTWVAELQRQVVRIRPAAVIPASLIDGRRFDAVALHHDLALRIDGHNSDLRDEAVASAVNELLLCLEDNPREDW